MEIEQHAQIEIISTKRDVLKEHYIIGAELSGKHGIPTLPPIMANFDGLKPVAFQKAIKEKKPRDSVCHFFQDDYIFERIWNNAIKYVDCLSNFRYVCTPDFSIYSSIPLTLQLYNTYRNRAIGFYLSTFGIDVISTVSWCGEESFGYCFDGLPKESTLAVSTNGCFSASGKDAYRRGFKEMCKQLNPCNVLVVGREIPVDCDIEITYMKSFGQELEEAKKGES